MTNYFFARALSLGVITLLAVGFPAGAEERSSEPATEFLSDRAYASQPIRRIAFGSCNKPKKDQGFWDVIRAKDPEFMLLLGDNHYAESTDSGTIEKGL